MPDCRHFEVCKLGAAFPDPAGGSCILHNPTQDKSVPDFDSAVKQQLAAGRSDFRYVHFTPNYTGLEDVPFPALADFRNAVSRTGLHLRRTRLPQGLKITGEAPLDLHLHGAIVNGPVEIEIPVLNMYANYPSEFHGDISIAVNEAREIHLQNATLVQRLTLRARTIGQCRLDGATIQGILDLSQCRFTHLLTFAGTRFSSSSELDLQGSHIPNDLIIIGRPNAPALIRLNGSEIDGKTHIEAELAASRIRIWAPSLHPRFGGNVTLVNVDLSECLLVGNSITRFQQMELTNVRWMRQNGRSLLYDEIAMCTKKAAVYISNIRETYQILKEKYRQAGDHLTSGDFHYGEMEMKRKEYGGVWQILCLEFVYWFLSGYGTRWKWALALLIALIAGFALAYCHVETAFSGNFMNALRFSLEVTTLQRPQTTETFGVLGKWLKAIQTVLGPLQIALFALALGGELRMGRKADPKQTVSFEEVLRSILYEQEALRRVPVRKGLVSNEEVLEEVKAVRRDLEAKRGK